MRRAACARIVDGATRESLLPIRRRTNANPGRARLSRAVLPKKFSELVDDASDVVCDAAEVQKRVAARRAQRMRAKNVACKKCNSHAGFRDIVELLAKSSCRLRQARRKIRMRHEIMREKHGERVERIHFSSSRFAVFFAVL